MSLYCQYCNKVFSRKDNLSRHIKENRCKLLKNIQGQKLVLKSDKKIQQLEKQLAEKDQQIAQLKNNSLAIETLQRLEKMEKQNENNYRQIEKRLDEKDKEIASLKEKPSTSINQILQVVCVGNNDNYLDMLTTEWNNFDRALEYIKECALSNLSGDCKLIEKIYLGGRNQFEQPSIRFLDKNRAKLSYFDENQNEIIDIKGMQLGKKLANNLQNSYLKGINYLINQNLINRLCPNKFLEDYDIQIWNQHIYELSDCQYQRKIINHLNIPQKND